MRFLLKYGLFENNGNEYYFKISDEEYIDFISDDLFKTYTSEEILKIKTLFPENFYFKLRHDNTNIHVELNERDYVDILKSDDEWYYIMYRHRLISVDMTTQYDNFLCGSFFRESHFKCDQYEGLKSFIEYMLSNSEKLNMPKTD